jgi:hypothetical protein
MRKMSDEEAEQKVVALLQERGKMTSLEVDSNFKDSGEKCPDSIVAFLASMRRKGLIKGEVSKEKKGWVWWVD